MKGQIAESTLLYSWGSATNGKLGNGIVNEKCYETSGYFREEMSNEVEKNIDNQWFTY